MKLDAVFHTVYYHNCRSSLLIIFPLALILLKEYYDNVREFSLERRDDSKLMLVDKNNGFYKHESFKNIDNY